MNKPFLLQGVDVDGETREFRYDTIEAARKTAADCTCTDASGPAWQAWAIWGNDPDTEEWRVLEQSMKPDTLKDDADQSAVLDTAQRWLHSDDLDPFIIRDEYGCIVARVAHDEQGLRRGRERDVALCAELVRRYNEHNALKASHDRLLEASRAVVAGNLDRGTYWQIDAEDVENVRAAIAQAEALEK